MNHAESESEPSNVIDFQCTEASGPRILIVEDEMLIALGLIDVVTALGASWVAGSRAANALVLAVTEKVDAAIVDMNLAGEPADAIIDALRARDIPFVITTGYGAEAIPEKYRSLPRLAKPYLPEQVQAALLGILTPSKNCARSV